MDGGTGIVQMLILTETIQLQGYVQTLILTETIQLQGQSHHIMVYGDGRVEEGAEAYCNQFQ